MQTAPLDHIECTLLHDAAQDLPEDELKACVTAVLSAAGLAPVEEPARSDGPAHELVFLAGGWRLRIETVSAPLPRDRLKFVLALPYTRTIFPEAGRVVEIHAAHTRLRLEKVEKSTQGGIAPFTDSREIMPAMSLVALTAREVMAHRPASAIYWAPSDHLLPPSLFETLTSDTRLILLNIRPQYFTDKAAPSDTDAVGMIAHGTQHLVGRLLVVAPSDVPLGELHGLAASVVMHILEQDRLPRPDERIAADGIAWHAVARPAPENHLPDVESLMLFPMPASADSAAGGRQARQAERPRTMPAGSPAAADVDLETLPPELREEIRSRRHRRHFQDDVVFVREMRSMTSYTVLGVIGLVVITALLVARPFMAMRQAPPPPALARSAMPEAERPVPAMPASRPERDTANADGDIRERRIRYEDEPKETDDIVRESRDPELVGDEEKAAEYEDRTLLRDEEPPEMDDAVRPLHADSDDGREVQDRIVE